MPIALVLGTDYHQRMAARAELEQLLAAAEGPERERIYTPAAVA